MRTSRPMVVACLNASHLSRAQGVEAAGLASPAPVLAFSRSLLGARLRTSDTKISPPQCKCLVSLGAVRSHLRGEAACVRVRRAKATVGAYTRRPWFHPTRKNPTALQTRVEKLGGENSIASRPGSLSRPPIPVVQRQWQACHASRPKRTQQQSSL
ncbi:hypothetical protein GGTG_06126 [Gaeumannomyces tritici R3-111a-1]|uniref:Uncharacterized protein n=1 Tax=Gaeumannomyces tritici (strain R3-111a-1) TaxID=644352 RepID=J3NXX1_GAET3|nr:hypothetical protein GGTG_06126 [Gaeumannomyces tritici R3-111a-1]EJT76204.1 hypothetical protein GGTG_06126 [Gaeumannomyces tritici R3-111a-1]